MEVAMYPINVAYHTLVSHCESEYKVALNALATIMQSKIAEMHQCLHIAQWCYEKANPKIIMLCISFFTSYCYSATSILYLL